MLRILKQIVFGSGFLVMFSLIIFGVYQFWQVAPTCSDRIQNQGEEGVDCGFVCGNTCLESLAPIEVKNEYLFAIVENETNKDYDALFKIHNPNTRFGASQIAYEILLFDSQNNLILKKPNFAYIGPGQTKFVFEPTIRTAVPARRVELKISRVEWGRLPGGLDKEEVKFTIRNKEYVSNGKPGVFSHVRGTVFNASNFDFDRVDVVVVLFKKEMPVRANRTDLRTFLAQTERYFEVDWVSDSGVVPERVDIEVSTNIFESYNFIRRYGTPEKFQQFY